VIRDTAIEETVKKGRDKKCRRYEKTAEIGQNQQKKLQHNCNDISTQWLSSRDQSWHHRSAEIHVTLSVDMQRLKRFDIVGERSGAASRAAGLGGGIVEVKLGSGLEVVLGSRTHDVGIVYRRRDRNRTRCARIAMAERERKLLYSVGREIILIDKNIVMSRSARSQETAVALEIKVELGRVGDGGIDDGSRRAVAGSVGITGVVGEKADVMAFANYNECNCRVDTQIRAGLLDEGYFLIDDSRELSF